MTEMNFAVSKFIYTNELLLPMGFGQGSRQASNFGIIFKAVVN